MDLIPLIGGMLAFFGPILMLLYTIAILYFLIKLAYMLREQAEEEFHTEVINLHDQHTNILNEPTLFEARHF